MAHRLVVCFIEHSLAHKWNAVAAPASCKRQLDSARHEGVWPGLEPGIPVRRPVCNMGVEPTRASLR